MSLGQSWVHQWSQLDVLEEYWALAAFPFRNSSSEYVNEPLRVNLKLEGRNNTNSRWTLIANSTQQFTLFCPRASYECDGWWLMVLSYIKYEQLQATVTFLPSLTRARITDVKFREQTANIDYNNLRLGFHLTFLTIVVVSLCVYLFIMRNKTWDQWTFEQKASMALMLALVGYNDPFFPLKFLVDSAVFPILGAILESAFQITVLLFWIFFLDRYRRPAGQPWSPFALSEIPKYVLVLSYFVFTLTLYSWVRAREQTEPIPGENLPTGVIVLFYLAAITFAAIVLYVVILVLITAGPIQGKARSYRRFMYVVIPTIIVMVCVTLGVFTNSFGPYGRTLTEYMFFTGVWNLYVWIIAYGAWPYWGRFQDSNPGDLPLEEGEEEDRIQFNDQDPSVDPLLESTPLVASSQPRKTTYSIVDSASPVTPDAPFTGGTRSDLGQDEGL